MADEAKYPAIVRSLLKPDNYDHPVDSVELIETHISWVFLTGAFVYKVKKPVDMGFLDFSTLEKRHYYCNEEFRLNSRLAPEIYLGVVTVTGPEDQATIAGSGNIIDYAVKMLQFPQQMQLDRMLAADSLESQHIDALARWVAEFHQDTSVASNEDHYGEPEQILKPMTDNISHLKSLLTKPSSLEKIDKLEQWILTQYHQAETIFVQRKNQGYIRECHGDLHLRNLAYIDESPLAFDCIEFDPELRWLDVISDAAFLIMDLDDRQQPEFAQQFLNTYLEITGDYNATKVIHFYLVHRALVRAKVEAITAKQSTQDSQAEKDAELAFAGYLELAISYLEPTKPKIIITYGMSASGKTTLSQPLVEKLPAIRIRSDVERKRLFNKLSSTETSADFNSGIYTSEASSKTYHYLTEVTEIVLDAGYTVIVDAAFLKHTQRQLFRQLANRKNVPFIILEFTAQPDTLRQRINSREKDMSDADQSVLEHQLSNWKPMSDEEQPDIIGIDTESSINFDELVTRIKGFS